MGAGTGFIQVELGAAGDDFQAVFDINVQGALEGKGARFTVHQSQYLNAEGGLEGGVFIKLVEHLVRMGVALELNDDAHTVAVRFVAQVADVFNPAFSHQFGDPFDHSGLIDLVRDFGDDNCVPTCLDYLNLSHTAHSQPAAAGIITLADTFSPDDDAAGGKIGAGHKLHQLIIGYVVDGII